MGGKDAGELFIKISRDSLDEREGTADRIWSNPKFSIDVTKDECQRFLDLVKVRGGQQLVQREILHQLVVFVHCSGPKISSKIRYA